MEKTQMQIVKGATRSFGIDGITESEAAALSVMGLESISEIKEALRGLRNEEAAAANAASGLVALIGSEKQISWAESIRARFVAESAEMVAAAASKGTPAQIEMLGGLRQSALNQASASFWIDRDGKPARQIMGEMAKK